MTDFHPAHAPYTSTSAKVQFGGITVGDTPQDARVPFKSSVGITADDTAGNNHVGHLMQTIIVGDWSEDTGADPGYGWGVNFFTVTGTSANDADGMVALYGGLLEAAIRAPSSTQIDTVIGLQGEASFFGESSAALVDRMVSVQVENPRRKGGAIDGVATESYGLYVKKVDAADVGATTARSVYVAGGATELVGSTKISGEDTTTLPFEVSLYPGFTGNAIRLTQHGGAATFRVTHQGVVASANTLVSWEGLAQQVSVGAVGVGTTSGIAFGSASDVVLYRSAANVLTVAAGDSLAVADGTWDGGTLRLGSYYLWVDGTGDLRIKSGTPSSDTDGTVVGAQS